MFCIYCQSAWYPLDPLRNKITCNWKNHYYYDNNLVSQKVMKTNFLKNNLLLRKRRYLITALWIYLKWKAWIVYTDQSNKRQNYRVNLVLILYERQIWECYYCKKKLSELFMNWLNVTIDHIMPISKSGKANDINNLCITCYYCNNNKKDMLPDDFERYLQENGWIQKIVAKKKNPIRSNIMFIQKKS